MVERNPPIIYTVGGHGAWNLLSMQNKEPLIAIRGVAKELSPTKKIIVTKDNDEVLASRVIHTISCHVSRGLGPSSVKKGCLAFAGYRKAFIWLVNTDGEPAVDDKAPAFFDCAFEFKRRLLKGRTFGEAMDATLQKFERTAKHTDDKDVARYLRWNASILEIHGNPETRLKDYSESA